MTTPVPQTPPVAADDTTGELEEAPDLAVLEALFPSLRFTPSTPEEAALLELLLQKAAEPREYDSVEGMVFHHATDFIDPAKVIRGDPNVSH